MNRSRQAFDRAPAQFAHPERARGQRAPRNTKRRRAVTTTAIAGTMAAVLAGGLAAWANEQPQDNTAAPEGAMPASMMLYTRTSVAQGQQQTALLEKVGLGKAASSKTAGTWAGTTIGTGLWVDDNKTPYTLVAVPTANRTAAKKALKAAAADTAGSLGYVVRKDTTLIALGGSDAQAAAEQAAGLAAQSNLTGNAALSGALKTTAGAKATTGWIDLAALRSGLSSIKSATDVGNGFLAKDLKDTTIPDSVGGQLTLSAQSGADGLDVKLRTSDLKKTAPVAAPSVLSKLSRANSNSAVAGSFSTEAGASPLLDLGSIAGLIGKYLPSLISGFLGQGALGGLVGQLIQGIIGKLIPGAGGNTNSADALGKSKQIDYSVTDIRNGKAIGTMSAEATGQSEASALSTKMDSLIGTPKVQRNGDKVQAASSAAASNDKALADDQLYRKTMSNMPADSGAAVFVNVGQYLRSTDQAAQKDLASVKSVGIGVGSSNNNIDLTVHSVVG